MKVLKFGGTSVGTVNSLNNVKKIVESIPEKAIIVVSALGGLTDKLISTAKLAATGDSSWLTEMEAIRQRHYDIIDNVVPESKSEIIRERIEKQLTGLQRNYEGVALLRSLPEKTLDIIVSFGERMSSIIVAEMVKNGKRYFSPDFIKTEKWYGKNIVDRKLTDRLIHETFDNLEENEKAIVPGFISTDSTSGEITNLGRGGSDYTGALLASALNADVLEIWTDVDGFMTADPRIVKDAIIIDHLSFTESMELCTFGAKVIYPPTIYPVFHGNIPIKILNTFNPEAPGTLINEAPIENDLDIKGVTSLKGISLFTINLKESDVVEDVTRRTYNTLIRKAVRIIPLQNEETSKSLNFAIASTQTDIFIDSLKKEFAPELSNEIIENITILENVAAVAMVGKDMKQKSRLLPRISNSLSRAGIKVLAVSPSTSVTTLVVIIPESQISEALPLIHSLIFT